MTIKEIKHVSFIGAGTMGCFNSLLAGMAGYDVTLFDISEEVLQLTEIVQEIIGAGLVEQNLFTAVEVLEGRRRIRLETNAARAVENADLLSESVPEKVELKRSVHAQFDELCPAHTIMTTNTSGILLSEIEDAVKRGDRFAAMHFHLNSTLVDVLGGPRTTGQTIDILSRFVKSMKCYPHINRKENAGYVYNAISMGMMQAIVQLVMKNKVSIEDVDRAWMIHSGEEIGPFGIMDLLGLNVVYDGSLSIARYPARREQGERMVTFLQPYMDRGESGMRTGKGLYTYPEPAYGKPGFRKPDPQDNDRFQAIINGLIIQALLLVIDEMASVEEVDRVWRLARQADTGPFNWLDDKGTNRFLAEISNPIFEGVYPTNRLDEVIAFLKK